MQKFKLAVDKVIFVNGVLTKLKAGGHETKDEALIKALTGAKNVELVEQKKPREAKEN